MGSLEKTILGLWLRHHNADRGKQVAGGTHRKSVSIRLETGLFRRVALSIEGRGQRLDTVQGTGDGMGRLERTGLIGNLLFFLTSAPGKGGHPGAQRRHRLPSVPDSLYFSITGAPRTLPRSPFLLSGCCLYSPSVR